MAEPSDQINQEEIFRKSMEDALSHIDELKATLSEEQQKAVDLQLAAKEELKRIKGEAAELSRAFFEQNKVDHFDRIRNEVLNDVAKKLIMAGVPSNKLRLWLDLTPESMAAVWHALGFEKMDEAHVGHVAYEGNVRSGMVVFYRDDGCVRFPYEMGHRNVIASIEIPAEDEWQNVTGLPNADRPVVLEFIARRVVRDQAPNGHFEIYANRIEIQS